MRTLSTGIIWLALVVATIGELSISTHAQVQPSASKQTVTPGPRVHRNSQRMYEDAEIKVVIPPGWRIAPQDEMQRKIGAGVSLGNSVGRLDRAVLLEKNGYTLAIAYHTGHASGVEGGRFIEIFNIPWPGLDDAWTCSGYLAYRAQPASRILIFTNITVESGDAKVRENCGIPKDLGRWIEKDGSKSFEGERRWFGGYFTTADGGWFFDSDGERCGQKAYTLTFQASTPDQLPVDGDPRVKKIVEEAIDVVDSIHYKRCPPAVPQ